MNIGTFLQQLPLDASEDLVRSGKLPHTLVPLSEVPKYTYLMQRGYISSSECYAALFGIDDPTFNPKHVTTIYQEVFMEEHTYTCTRCGDSTHYQAENPWPVSHPLGRFCKNCLPVLFEGKTAQELIVEAAQYRSAMRGSFVTEDASLPEYEKMQFAPSDWPVEPDEN